MVEVEVPIARAARVVAAAAVDRIARVAEVAHPARVAVRIPAVRDVKRQQIQFGLGPGTAPAAQPFSLPQERDNQETMMPA